MSSTSITAFMYTSTPNHFSRCLWCSSCPCRTQSLTLNTRGALFRRWSQTQGGTKAVPIPSEVKRG